MLRLCQISEEIADCYLGAEQARTQARQAHDPALKKESLEMERRWIALARSYEFIESLSDSNALNDQRRLDRKFVAHSPSPQHPPVRDIGAPVCSPTTTGAFSSLYSVNVTDRGARTAPVYRQSWGSLF